MANLGRWAEFTVSDIYQSNGACSTTCAGYAFAVVQWKSCWCSDYIPADTTSTGSCSAPCPGYPDELCGDESSGLYGYVALGKAPLGTQGAVASSSPPEETSTAQETQVLQSMVETVSTQFLSGPTFGSHFSQGLASHTHSTDYVLRSSLPALGFPSPAPPDPISFQTEILTQFVQNSPSDPSPVTVQNTVTASQSVQISYVSIVCPALS